jgi:hypothetical protein
MRANCLSLIPVLTVKPLERRVLSGRCVCNCLVSNFCSVDRRRWYCLFDKLLINSLSVMSMSG